MVVYGLNKRSLLGNRVDKDENTSKKTNLLCEALFRTTNTNIKFDGPDCNFRPWLELTGKIEKLYAEFDENLTEIQFSEKNPCDARFRYDFSEIELSELAQKGFFSREYEEKGLNVPAIFQEEQVLELPLFADVNLVQDDNLKVAFVDIKERNYLVTDALASGYQDGFAQYFADLKEVKLQEEINFEQLEQKSEKEVVEIAENLQLLDFTQQNDYKDNLKVEQRDTVLEEKEVEFL